MLPAPLLSEAKPHFCIRKQAHCRRFARYSSPDSRSRDGNETSSRMRFSWPVRLLKRGLRGRLFRFESRLRDHSPSTKPRGLPAEMILSGSQGNRQPTQTSVVVRRRSREEIVLCKQAWLPRLQARSLLVALRPMAAVPSPETLARLLFSPPASRLLAAASLQKRRALGCAAALRPKGSAADRPP